MKLRYRKYIPDGGACVLFCSVDNAEELIDNDPEIGGCLVISPVIPNDTVVMVPEQEFLDWLYGNEEEQE